MIPPTSIDGTDITGATIDGTDVQEITVDGDVVFSGAIPDTQLDHLWLAPTATQADPWVDENGSIDVSSEGSPSLTGSINSNTAMFYDGVDDYHTASSAATTGPNAEHTFVAVVKVNTTGNATIFNNGQGSGTDGYRYLYSSIGEYAFISNGQELVSGGSTDANPTVIVGAYDGTNIIIDVNGTEVLNTSVATPNIPTSELDIGDQGDEGNFWDGVIGAVGHESGFGNATRRNELTNSFADAFSITL